MYRERVSDDIFVFTSSVYAQVTAGVILTSEGSIIIDTLLFPSETRYLVEFATQHSPAGVRYVILSHYHADHVYGACRFPGAEVVAHANCRQLLIERAQAGLAIAREQTPELSDVELVLPGVVFDEGDMTLRLGDKSLELLYMPGHSSDLTSIYVKDDKILFASDAVMPLPHIVDGDPETLIETLRRIKAMNLEMIIQGHGEMILRGEIAEALNSNIKYLEAVQSRVSKVIAAGKGREGLAEITIESCGKSRIALNGLVQRLHAENVMALYARGTAKPGK
jgi:cyclase